MILKELAFPGYIFELTKENEIQSITDYHPSLLPLCITLEEILRKGLIYSQSTPFGLTKKDYGQCFLNFYHIYKK